MIQKKAFKNQAKAFKTQAEELAEVKRMLCLIMDAMGIPHDHSEPEDGAPVEGTPDGGGELPPPPSKPARRGRPPKEEG